jgi:hypothetical protein
MVRLQDQVLEALELSCLEFQVVVVQQLEVEAVQVMCIDHQQVQLE